MKVWKDHFLYEILASKLPDELVDLVLQALDGFWYKETKEDIDYERLRGYGRSRISIDAYRYTGGNLWSPY